MYERTDVKNATNYSLIRVNKSNEHTHLNLDDERENEWQCMDVVFTISVSELTYRRRPHVHKIVLHHSTHATLLVRS